MKQRASSNESGPFLGFKKNMSNKIAPTPLGIVSLSLLILIAISPNVAWIGIYAFYATPLEPLHQGLIPGLIGIAVLLVASPWVWQGALILLFLAIPSLFETWYIYQFGKPSDSQLLGVVFESDAAESLAFLSGLWPHISIASLLLLLIAVPAIRDLRNKKARWPCRSRRIILTAGAFGVLLLNAEWLAPLPSPQLESEFQDRGLLNESLEEKLSAYSKSWPTGGVVRLLSIWHQQHAMQKARSELASFRFGARSVGGESGNHNETIVLIIGESSRPDHWQLNGYHRHTTPRLAAIENLVTFTDVVSPWAWTRMAVPIILTRKPAAEKVPFFAEKSVISAFKESGFLTTWLSNQNALGKHESSTYLYAREADIVNYYNPAGYLESGGYDDVLISPLKHFLAQSFPKKLIILHTLGSHFRYTSRYPPEFDVFKPSTADGTLLSLHDASQAEFLLNAYDNSITYTDSLLAQVIGILAGTGGSAALLYVADHGENLFADNCGFSGHGYETEHDFRVPLLFWYSSNFGERHEAIVASARANSGKPISTTSVFSSLLELGGISLPSQSPGISIFSNGYQPSPRWVHASGGLLFDEARRDSSCRLTPS